MKHPVVSAKSMTLCVGYADAETIVRAQRDPESVAAIKEIDAARTKAKTAALALGKDMAGRLGLSGEQVKGLVAALAANPDLETWLLRRVNLTRASAAPPADDEHPVNE